MSKRKNTEEVTEEVSTNGITTITPAELAAQIGSDAKSIRRKLRSLTDERPGKGGRWAIPTDVVDQLIDAMGSNGKTTVFSLGDDGHADEIGSDEVADLGDEILDLEEV